MSGRDSASFPVVVSGPSGVGKTTIVERVLSADPLLCASISATTREARANEMDGRDYFFVTPERFEEMKQGGDLVEWAEVHGAFYGTPQAYVEERLAQGFDVLLNIDIQGGNSVRKVFPDAVMIFILPPSFDVLEKRIRSRGGMDPGELERRLETARIEITASRGYDYLIINDHLDRATRDLGAVVVAERRRRSRCRTGPSEGNAGGH